MDLGLKGKVALVTGGSRGIGAGICEVFAEEGADIVMNYVSNSTAAETLAERLRSDYGVRVLTVQADVGSESDIVNMFNKACDELGNVDIVINNANFMNDSIGPIEDFDPEKFKGAEAADVEAMMVTSRELVRRCKAGGREGHIVNILSKSAFFPGSTNNTSYITVKGAAFTFTRGLAYEVAKDRIYVNAVVPGYVRNDRTDVNSERYRQTIERIPLKKYAEPVEIGYVVAFLCSERACQCNGAIVDCSGGTMNGQ